MINGSAVMLGKVVLVHRGQHPKANAKVPSVHASPSKMANAFAAAAPLVSVVLVIPGPASTGFVDL